MRAALIISFLALYYTANTRADLSIHYEKITPDQVRPFNSVMIKRTLVRFEQAPDAAQSVMINLESGDIVQLHSASRRYFRINAQTINEYANFYQRNKTLLSGLIDRGLQQLAPQQRQQLEQLVNGYKGGVKDMDQLEIRPGGSNGQVLGAECSVFAVYHRGLLQREVCISSYQQLGLSSQDVQSLEQLKSFVQQFRDSAPRQQRELFDLLASTLADIRGLPMKIVSYYPDGKVRNIVQAASISLRTIPDAAYLIPEEYQQHNLPVL